MRSEIKPDVDIIRLNASNRFGTLFPRVCIELHTSTGERNRSTTNSGHNKAKQINKLNNDVTDIIVLCIFGSRCFGRSTCHLTNVLRRERISKWFHIYSLHGVNAKGSM